MQRLVVVLAATFVSGFASNVWAAFENVGCGPAAVIMKNDDGAFTFLSASTTNYSTSGMTRMLAMVSSTSGCKFDGLVHRKTRTETFVLNNFPKINTEMAQGQGENLHALGTSLGCSNVDLFSKKMKQNYEKIMTSEKTTPQEMLQNMRTQIQTDDTLKQICFEGGQV